MKRGQTTLEYVYLVGVVAVAVIAMLVYISRGFQGRLRTNANQVGEQYSPGNMTTNLTQTSVVSYNESMEPGETGTTINNTSSVITNSGYEKVNSLKND
ncbi:MAG: hypothetical protein WCY09_07500 [Candidatus Omnitrophota bacterium]